MIPLTVLTTNPKSEDRTPVDGKLGLQLDSGVLTNRLQLLSSEGTPEIGVGSNDPLTDIANCPVELVVATAITFPAPHWRFTVASANKIQQPQCDHI